jgi:flagellar biogenesis protein FliO
MDGIAVLRIVGAIGVIAALLYALVVVQRMEFRLPGRRRLLSVIETAPLPNGASLHVVKIGDEFYVIGRGSAEVSVLCQLPADRVKGHLAELAATAPRPFGLPGFLRSKPPRPVTKGGFSGTKRNRTGVR